MRKFGKAANFLNVVRITVGIVFLVTYFGYGQDLSSWVWRYPLPQGNSLFDIISVSNRFVAVGEHGTILTSRDGLSWTIRATNTSHRLRAAGYGLGRFQAVGDFGSAIGSGVILTSPSGVTWTTRPTSNTTFTAVASCSDIPSSSQSVAVGYSSCWTSYDGVVWNGPFNTGYTGLLGMAYGKGLFVATGGSGAIVTMQATAASVLNPTWTSQPSPVPYQLSTVYYGNGLFLIAGQSYILKSSDGTNWSNAYTTQAPAGLRRIAFGSNTYVVAGPNVGSSQIVISHDAQSWTETTIPGVGINAVAYGNGRFIGVGDYGLMMHSTDGTNWSQTSSQVRPTWTTAAYGAGKLVAVGSAKSIAASPDGTTALGQLTVTNVSKTIYAVGKFLSVGANGRIASSPDGVTWTTVSSGVTNSINDVLYTNNIFVAVGDSGLIMNSLDGVVWHSQPAVTNKQLNTLFYSEGAFNAVGFNGILLRSTNSTNWVSVPFTGTTNAIYGNGIWVEVQHTLITSGLYKPTLLSSTNGQQWVSRVILPTASMSTVPLIFANGTFIAMNGAAYGISTNGVDWVTNSFNIGNSINAVAVSTDKLAAVGSEGTVLETGRLPGLQPAQLSQPVFVPPNTFQMLMTAEPDERYRAQRSSTMQSWEDLDLGSSVVFGQGTNAVVITDTNAYSTNQSYRVTVYP